MSLEMRPDCERCGLDLPAEAPGAFICSFECTFCAECADTPPGMNPALAALAFAPGLAIGSFLSVVAARVPLKRSLLRPRSACMACSAPIAWYDSIPLASYVVLRGKCRICGTKIGLVYPAVDKYEVASIVRRLLKHSAFNSQSKRMGKILRLSSAGISYWQRNVSQQEHVTWA